MRNEATELETQPADAKDVALLAENFRVFNQITRNLESAYAKLSRRAAGVDGELMRVNAALEKKVRELEAATTGRASILDALPSGVVVIDPAGVIQCVNPAASKILGRRAQELAGRSRDALVGPTGERLLIVQDAPERARPGAAERELCMLDGSRRRISTVIAPLADGGELQVLTDLTVVARLREQVTRLDTLAALGEMAAGVAHEIRNPLNGIDGFAALLARGQKNGDLGQNAERYTENIRRGVREVNAIIANLLTFAAPEKITTSPILLAPLLADVAAEASGFDDTGARVEVTVMPAARQIAVAGDALKLKIALRNLVKNACEAVKSKSPVKLTLTLDAGGRRALIHVEDQGPGIPDEVRAKLYRPFTTTKAQGTGLGLAIAHKLVMLHGGELKHEDLTPGTRFTCALPALVTESRS